MWLPLAAEQSRRHLVFAWLWTHQFLFGSLARLSTITLNLYNTCVPQIL